MEMEEEESTKVNSSTFLITIGTNVRSYQTRMALARDIQFLKTQLTSLFNDPDKLRDIIEIQVPADTFAHNIGTTEADIGIEYARHTSGLHAHVTLRIMHTTRLRINLLMLRRRLKEMLEPILGTKADAKPHVHVNFLKDNVRNARRYVYKHARGRKLRMHEDIDWPEEGCRCTCRCQIEDLRDITLE
jgi:hypothetical protein